MLRASLFLSFALLAYACSSDPKATDGATQTGTGGSVGGAGNGSGGTADGSGGTADGGGGTADGSGGLRPVSLGSAANYVILAKAEISSVPTAAITGDVGLSPAAASYITGFALTRDATRWTAPEITGAAFAADNDAPTPSELTTAVSDMETAYTDAAGRPTPDSLNLGTGDIGGMTLAPGLHKWTSSVTIPTDLTLAGASDDVWILQVTGDLSIAAAKRVTLSGGARAQNIFWQVAGAVNLGTGAHFEGIVLSQTAITLGTGASTHGRLLAQTAVSLDGATVTQPSE